MQIICKSNRKLIWFFNKELLKKTNLSLKKIHLIATYEMSRK